MRLGVILVWLLCGTSPAGAGEGERQLASQEVGGVAVSLHGWIYKKGWLQVRLDNPSELPVRVQFTAVLQCASQKTPVVTKPVELSAGPGKTQKSDGEVDCPGLDGRILAFEATDVRFTVVSGQRATCAATLPTFEIGLNPRREVAWVRVKTAERTSTLSRATLLGLPEPPAADPPRPRKVLLLGGEHAGRPAAVSMEALLLELCKHDVPAPALRAQMVVALGNHAVRAVEAAVKLYCAHVKDPDCAPCIRKRIKPSEGVRG